MEQVKDQESNTVPQIGYQHKGYTMILLAYNEEARIKRVIEYYRPFARLIVVDNFSTDATKSIAEQLDVEVVQYRNPGTSSTPECMRYYSSLASTDYILFISCSEFIPPTLLKLFDDVASKRSYDIVSCVRDSYTCGELIPLWGGRFSWLDVRVERFMNKKGVDIDNIVIHGTVPALNKDRVLTLPRKVDHVIIHLRDADARSLMLKSLDYAYVEATQRHQKSADITGYGLIGLFAREVVRFFHLPVKKWNKIALREVWARMIMHSITYWIGWELRSARGIDYSHQRSDQLWQLLVAAQMPSDRMERSDRVHGA